MPEAVAIVLGWNLFVFRTLLVVETIDFGTLRFFFVAGAERLTKMWSSACIIDVILFLKMVF